MTLIDNISLDFLMQDEGFTRRLYADWDRFCRESVTELLDEFFTRYDSQDTYIEIDRLDLDLGSIPQEEFYDLFPVRLREALERSFAHKLNETGVPQITESDINTETDPITGNPFPYAREKRFENLLHYLEYGFCLPEWDAPEFHLYEELQQFKDAEHTGRLLSLLASKPYVMDRLFLQTGAERLPEAIPFAVWLASAVLSRYEKQRYLSAVLEHSPQAVIRFIHETKETGSLEDMAGLIENPHVRRIMAAETEERAEIGVPDYWYRLYGWLLKYYPFNGVPMFGDKPHFRLHLNRRLLSFIHKRERQAYLSKAELTVRFLMEVFGADHHQTVLGIIYRNQRLNSDSSPATGDSYAWELYYMLLQLSLLGTEQIVTGHTGRQPSDEKTDTSLPDTGVAIAIAENAGSFLQWVEDMGQPDHIKRAALLRLAQEKPELLIQWLKSRSDRWHFSLSASLTDRPILLLLAGYVSLQLAEVVSALLETFGKVSPSVSWLQGIGKGKLTEALNTAVFRGISTGIFSASDSASVQMLRLAALLYKEITGQEIPDANVAGFKTIEDISMSESVSEENTNLPGPIREFLESVSPVFAPAHDTWKNIHREKHLNKNTTEALEIVSLKVILSDNRSPESVRKMLVLQRFDAYRNRESELIAALQSEKLLDTVIGLLDTSILRHIAMRLAVQAYSTSGQSVGTTAIQLVGVLAGHMATIAGIVSGSARAVWKSLLLSLASWNDSISPASASGNVDTAIRLFAAIAGNDRSRIKAVVESLIGQSLPIPYTEFPVNKTTRSFDTGGFLSDNRNNALWSLLVRVRQCIDSGSFASADDNPDMPTESNLAWNEVLTAFEQHLNEASGVTHWLQNQAFTSWQKREVLHRYMEDSPKEAIRLLRDTIVSDESMVTLWAEIIGKDAVSGLIEQAIPTLSGILSRTVGVVYSAFTENGLFAGGSEEWELSVTKSILLLITEQPEPDSMDTEEIISLFLLHLHYVLAGNKDYTDADKEQWERVERLAINTITLQTGTADTGTGTASGLTNNVLPLEDSISGQEESVFDEWITWLLSPSVSDTAKSLMLRHYARWQPDLLWKFVRYSTTDNPGRNDIPFGQWTKWLNTETWMEMIAGVSFSLAETLRRTTDVIARKYGLAEPALSEGLVRFIACYPADRIYYGNASPVVREYIETLASSVWKDRIPDTKSGLPVTVADGSRPEHEETDNTSQPDERQSALEAIVGTVETELHIADTGQALEEAVQPEYIEIPNAGLCLLAIWFPRLLDMLGLLAETDDGRKDLKDTEARIRAIFILQRLATDEAREYEEHELAFNRILTGCPFHVPLPKTLKLIENEIQTVESMLAGVKANWEKLKNISVKGFQHSFIERPGRLEQREDKWLLYVEKRAYDILLDSLPWLYRQIRLPWLKKKISVIWRDKEGFDFE